MCLTVISTSDHTRTLADGKQQAIPLCTCPEAIASNKGLGGSGTSFPGGMWSKRLGNVFVSHVKYG